MSQADLLALRVFGDSLLSNQNPFVLRAIYSEATKYKILLTYKNHFNYVKTKSKCAFKRY